MKNNPKGLGNLGPFSEWAISLTHHICYSTTLTPHNANSEFNKGLIRQGRF